MRSPSNCLPPTFEVPCRPLIIVLSGPSGVGKDAVLARMKELKCQVTQVVTATTRSRRPAEREGIDYHFVPPEKFQQMIEQGEMLEHANVYGNWYGVPRARVRALLEQGRDVVIKVDIQGAMTIKKLVPQAVFIFLLPPSPGALFERLKQRKTESPADMERRLKAAEDEISKLPLFDYAVVNRWDEIDAAVADIQAIITAEKHRVSPREIVV